MTLRDPQPPRPCQWVKYVRHHEAAEYAARGWIAFNSLDGTHHGEWSVLMGWPGDLPASELPPGLDEEFEHVARAVGDLEG